MIVVVYEVWELSTAALFIEHFCLSHFMMISAWHTSHAACQLWSYMYLFLQF